MEMTDIKTCVRSLTRGRARLRHERLSGLDAQTIETAESFLMGLEGVTSAVINPRVGSLLLTWDESVTNAETLLESAQFFMAFLGDDEDAPHDACGSEPCCGDCDSAESASQTASHADSCRCCESARGAIRAVEGAIHRTGGAALDLFFGGRGSRAKGDGLESGEIQSPQLRQIEDKVTGLAFFQGQGEQPF